MRYEKMVYQGKIYTEKYKIDEILIAKKLNWLIDAEVENLSLEIHTKEDQYTLIINAGRWFNGIFQYGVIRDIEWLNGIFKNGVWYNGTWKNGIFEHGLIFNGRFYNGQILNGKIHGGEFFDIEIAQQVKKIEEVQPQTQPTMSGQTQAQPSGQTQAQPQQQEPAQLTPEEQEQQGQEQIKNVAESLNYSEYIYIKESAIMVDEDDFTKLVESVSAEPIITPLVRKGDKVNIKLLLFFGEPESVVHAYDDSFYSSHCNLEIFSYLMGGDMMMTAIWDGNKWISG
jgi:hypothetical protein